MIEYPPIHVLDMGETGTGKSTFAATFPKPLLVWFFDPFGKDRPYKKGATQVGEIQEATIADRIQLHYCDIAHDDGPIRLEYYHSVSPYHPTGYSDFMARMSVFHLEYNQWKTVVVDSATFMELEARKWHQYKLNPDAKDGRQWFGGSTDLLEEMLMMRFASLPMNVLTLAHIDEDKDELYGEIVKNPAMPGRLRKRLASAYAEHYRSYVIRQEDGSLAHALQTTNNGRYAAQSQIGAPEPCYPSYVSLWVNWKGAE